MKTFIHLERFLERNLENSFEEQDSGHFCIDDNWS